MRELRLFYVKTMNLNKSLLKYIVLKNSYIADVFKSLTQMKLPLQRFAEIFYALG